MVPVAVRRLELQSELFSWCVPTSADRLHAFDALLYVDTLVKSPIDSLVSPRKATRNLRRHVKRRHRRLPLSGHTAHSVAGFEIASGASDDFATGRVIGCLDSHDF